MGRRYGEIGMKKNQIIISIVLIIFIDNKIKSGKCNKICNCRWIPKESTKLKESIFE
jgi:hypothetical protein